MASLYTLLAIVALQSVIVYSLEASCVTVSGLEGCACRDSETNQIISLQSFLNDTDKPIPRFSYKSDINWVYGYQPCGTFDMYLNVHNPHPGYSFCLGSTVGRYEDVSVKQCYGLGDLSGAKFEYHENITYPMVSNLTVTYRNITNKQGAVISLICDQSITRDQSKFKYINTTEKVQETYYFSLRSPCACPGGCTVKIPSTTEAPTTTSESNTTAASSTTLSGSILLTPNISVINIVVSLLMMYGMLKQ